MKLYILFESAAGYALFEKEEMEEIAVEMPKLQAAIASMELFSKLVTLKAFQPFHTSEKALDNMKAIADGHVTSDLAEFLDTNVPKTAKKKKGKEVEIKLGVNDSKLASEYVLPLLSQDYGQAEAVLGLQRPRDGNHPWNQAPLH